MSNAVKTTDCDHGNVTGVTEKDRVTAVLRTAKGLSKAIVATTPTGREYQYFPVMLESSFEMIWLEHDCRYGTSETVPKMRVWNMVYVSSPDVELREEAYSAFAVDDGGDSE